MPHSQSLAHLSARKQVMTSSQGKISAEPASSASTTSCVICTKTLILFNAARAHSAFDKSLTKTPYTEWSLRWTIDAPDPKIYPQFAFPHDNVSVLMTVDHKGGYGWGVGGFKIYPDWNAIAGKGAERKNLGDYPVIALLDVEKSATGSQAVQQPELDFSSTLSSGTLSLIASWGKECGTSHLKCQQIFPSPGQSAAKWFPDRLIRLTRTQHSETTGTLTARVALKSDANDFPPDEVAKGVNYLSLSHCWGPPPDATAPLQGRAKTVLTKANLPVWRVDLPLDDLPLTFQHAAMVCASLGFRYIWIDSLCILQDSIEDWQEQSAVMGDVYKYAWLNIAALSATSDSEGFINENRDARVEFGFRLPLDAILGRKQSEENSERQECVLLRGNAKLLWNFAADIPGSNSSNAPLFKRAWVYQERSLARRTLGFTHNAVYWACDECSHGERPDWNGAGLSAEGLRGTMHTIITNLSELANSRSTGVLAPAQKAEKYRTLFDAFDSCWFFSVTSYTLCGLTKHTDKLIAVSSVARELGSTRIVQNKYLAGLWDINLPSQLAWITVGGRTTPKRKRVGELGYVAPSWSWASIEAPVQPRFIFDSQPVVVLADVLAAEVVLETDYAFGTVKAGYLRMKGRLNSVTSAETKPYHSWNKESKQTSLTDEAIGEKLWFCSDTIEGFQLAESGKDFDKLRWVPLTLRFDAKMLACTCLILLEVEASESVASQFVKPDEKIYRRLGTGDFGRIPSMLQQDKLLLSLGSYSDVEVQDGQGQKLMKGFKRREDDFREFVII